MVVVDRFVPSSESLFLIGGIAPNFKATHSGRIAHNEDFKKKHNFAPADIYVMKLQLQSSNLSLRTKGKMNEGSKNISTPRLGGIWMKVTTTGNGPGEISGHTAVLDSSKGRYIFVYGGIRRQCKSLDAGMYILDTYNLNWNYIAPPQIDNSSPDSLFLKHLVQDVVIPPARKNHGAFVIDNSLIIFGGCSSGKKYAQPVIYWRPLVFHKNIHNNQQIRYSPLQTNDYDEGTEDDADSLLNRFIRVNKFIATELLNFNSLAEQMIRLPEDSSLERKEMLIESFLEKKRMEELSLKKTTTNEKNKSNTSTRNSYSLTAENKFKTGSLKSARNHRLHGKRTKFGVSSRHRTKSKTNRFPRNLSYRPRSSVGTSIW